MKWYWWLIIAVVIIVIVSVVVYKTKTKTPKEGSECIISASNRTAIPTTLPVNSIQEKGVIINGICVKK